jgi:hypothetical protein
MLANERSLVDTHGMNESAKRTVQVNVKMSEDDFALLLGAANCRWPEAIISNSGVLLGLAKIAAKRILETNPES